MTPGVIRVHIVIVVFPVPGARVIRRVQIHAVDLALIEKRQQLKCMKILPADDRMEGLVLSPPNRVDRRQRRVDRLPKPLKRKQLPSVHRDRLAFRDRPNRDLITIYSIDPERIRTSNVLPQIGRHPRLQRKVRQESHLRNVLLKDQSKPLTPPNLLRSFPQLRTQIPIRNLPDQIVELRHPPPRPKDLPDSTREPYAQPPPGRCSALPGASEGQQQQPMEMRPTRLELATFGLKRRRALAWAAGSRRRCDRNATWDPWSAGAGDVPGDHRVARATHRRIGLGLPLRVVQRSLGESPGPCRARRCSARARRRPPRR